jgi:hypothetical protein
MSSSKVTISSGTLLLRATRARALTFREATGMSLARLVDFAVTLERGVLPLASSESCSAILKVEPVDGVENRLRCDLASFPSRLWTRRVRPQRRHRPSARSVMTRRPVSGRGRHNNDRTPALQAILRAKATRIPVAESRMRSYVSHRRQQNA